MLWLNLITNILPHPVCDCRTNRLGTKLLDIYIPTLKFLWKADFVSYHSSKKFSILLHPQHCANARNICLWDPLTCSCIQLYTYCSVSPTIRICRPQKKRGKKFSYIQTNIQILVIKTNVTYNRLKGWQLHTFSP